MPAEGKNTRLYNEKELQRLIQRATELQQEKAEGRGVGLSLKEIERIAQEMGLDPQHLHRAASELDRGQIYSNKMNFWGHPFQIDASERFEGVLTDSQWDEVVKSLRWISSSLGQTHENGNKREWRVIQEEPLGHTHVVVTPIDEYSNVDMSINYRGSAYLAYLLSFFVGGALTGIMLDGAGLPDPALFGLFGTGLVTSLLLMRTGIKYWANRQQNRLKQFKQVFMDQFASSELLSEKEKLAEQPESGIELPDQNGIANEAENTPVKQRTRS